MSNSKPPAISDCGAFCDNRLDIKNCKTDCLACQSAKNDHILYDCHTSGHKKCKEIEFIHRCQVPEIVVPEIVEGFSYSEENNDIQVLATASIILLFLLYVLKNKHYG
jgi:hypothetical protein